MSDRSHRDWGNPLRLIGITLVTLYAITELTVRIGPPAVLGSIAYADLNIVQRTAQMLPYFIERASETLRVPPSHYAYFYSFRIAEAVAWLIVAALLLRRSRVALPALFALIALSVVHAVVFAQLSPLGLTVGPTEVFLYAGTLLIFTRPSVRRLFTHEHA